MKVMIGFEDRFIGVKGGRDFMGRESRAGAAQKDGKFDQSYSLRSAPKRDF